MIKKIKKKWNQLVAFFKNIYFPKAEEKLEEDSFKEYNIQDRTVNIDKELKQQKEKLSNFLITSKVKKDKVIEYPNYILNKTGQGLYKLEGKEENGREYSIIINTGNYLSLSNEKIVGFIQVSEAELNRMLTKNHLNLTSVMNEFPEILLSDSSYDFLTEGKGKQNWKEIIGWNLFWKEQVFLHLSPNVMALLLISLGDLFKAIFDDVITDKQKKLVADELYFLNQNVGLRENSPHSKVKGIYNFDYAIDEFKKSIEKVKAKMEKEI